MQLMLLRIEVEVQLHASLNLALDRHGPFLPRKKCPTYKMNMWPNGLQKCFARGAEERKLKIVPTANESWVIQPIPRTIVTFTCFNAEKESSTQKLN
jgi:hypothetical protein